jgi:hypothetical protein
MQGEKDSRVKSALSAEIEELQKHYATIIGYLSGREFDNIEIIATLQVFKDGLNRISSHILTLYVLKGQKTKITWQSLLGNLENASATLQSTAHPNPKSAIELAFNMSQPNAQEVMAYLAKLKESLKLSQLFLLITFSITPGYSALKKTGLSPDFAKHLYRV